MSKEVFDPVSYEKLNNSTCIGEVLHASRGMVMSSIMKFKFIKFGTAEELTSILFFRILTKPENINRIMAMPHNQRLAFLSRCATNTAIDLIRKNKRICDIKTSSRDFSILEELSSCRESMYYGCIPEIHSEAFKKEESSEIMKYLFMLSEKQFEVIAMRMNDVPFRIIAKKLRISINTALGRYRYGVTNLKRFGLTNTGRLLNAA